jgi:hypothetical protein
VVALTFGCRPATDPEPGKKPAGRSPSRAATAWFTEITDESGLRFSHESGASGELHMPEIMSSGSAFFDFNNDQRLDVYLTNGNEHLPETRISSRHVNRLFMQSPSGRFVDVTEESGLGDGHYGMGATVGDIDNDGFADMYVSNYGHDQLYRNNGDGTFSNVTESWRIDVDGWSCSAAFVDIDLDGWLDLYVTRYLDFQTYKKCTDRSGRPNYCSPQAFLPQADVLLRNTGRGSFVDVSESSGIRSGKPCAGLGVVSGDFNEDGHQDIFVANDGYPNKLLINQGNGQFQDQAVVLGAAFNRDGMHEAGMGVVADDFDNDNDLDLFMTHLSNETNTLYRNMGFPRGFEDATLGTGLGKISMPWTGFGVVVFDADADGQLDITIANGRVSLGPARPDSAVPAPWDAYAEPNLFLVGDGTLSFRNEPGRCGTLCSRIEVSRSMVGGDIDRDGDIDLLVTQTHGPARLFRNDAPRRGQWLMVDAIDPARNRPAIGAVVTLHSTSGIQSRLVARNKGYLSSSPPVAHFGVVAGDTIDRITIRWPGAGLETWKAAGTDRYITIRRGTGN